MSEPEESSRRLDGGEVAGGTDEASATGSGAASESGRGDVRTTDVSDPGVGLGVGEPNTFEPEEAGPAADRPAE